MSVRLSPSSVPVKCKARPTSKPTEDVQLLPLSLSFLSLSRPLSLISSLSKKWHLAPNQSFILFLILWQFGSTWNKNFLARGGEKVKKMSDIWNSIWVQSDRIKNVLFKLVSSLLSCAEAPLGPSARLSVHSHQPLSLGTLIVLWKVLRIISLRPRHVLN